MKIKEKVEKETDAQVAAGGVKDQEEVDEEEECESDDSSALRPSSPGMIVYGFDLKSSRQNPDRFKLLLVAMITNFVTGRNWSF